MVPFACTFKTFCACTAYSIIIGDSFSSLFGATPGKFLALHFHGLVVCLSIGSLGRSFTSTNLTRPQNECRAHTGFPALLAKRTNVIAWMTSLVLLPLCMLKSFAPLAPFSILGILGTMFTAGVLALRLLDGSYAPGGKFYSVSRLVDFDKSAHVIRSIYHGPRHDVAVQRRRSRRTCGRSWRRGRR